MDKNPPLLPRQSTSDVLSFTKIIADRLAPGQNVWDYFSPAPVLPVQPVASQSPTIAPVSPVLPLSPTSPTTSTTSSSSSFSFFGNKRQSVLIDTSKRPPLPPSPPQCVSPTSISFSDANTVATAAAAATMDALGDNGVTPKAHKRKSFAQSLRHMLSLSQLLTPSSTKSGTQAQSKQQPTGPPHYNILVLGSDSAPLASTLYKMSSLLPSTNKISHYQEISGFFVAYFRSNGSFTCSPKSSTELSDRERRRRSRAFKDVAGSGDSTRSKRQSAVVVGLEEIDHEDDKSSTTRARAAALAALTGQRSSEESQSTLLNARLSKNRSDSSSSVASSSSGTYDNGDDSDRSAEEATLCQEPLEDDEGDEQPAQPTKASANASLSVHAFSLDTTWPLPRLLAQTFWFPHAHGIIYIVDATRKNDPRGMDHLINARQFLSSLIADPHFKRRDIPVVVFANKAGMDDETCFRVDEIADILGCEEWDHEGRVSIESGRGVPVSVGSAAARPWCVKSTRSDGEGEGLRESVEWLKSRMGEIWKV
ncbi:hypothetical protein BGW39_009226 [Mortierella sp. 14UC]|nr:hypothetical protein BGW39_009226 [Mortierella sp. 14UC]